MALIRNNTRSVLERIGDRETHARIFNGPTNVHIERRERLE